MDSHGHDPHPAPEPREFSHPALWTAGLVAIIAALGWVFFHQIAAGREAAKGEPAYTVPKAASGPDHQTLIADRSQAVLDRGEVLYGKNCASCHGAAGDSNPSNITPHPRVFKAEALRNKLGGGPYAWYLVLTNGFGSGMPGFRNLSPEDRYAVLHFVRETWVKPNSEIYAADDPPEVAKQIPAKGGAAGEAAVDPATVHAPRAVQGVMARLAAAEAVRAAAVRDWLARAGAAGPLPGLDGVADLARRRSAGAQDLLALARRGEAAALAAALADEDAEPALATMDRDDLQRLAARLVGAAGAVPEVTR